jgi:Uri superfamily endonuclease
MVSSNSGVYQLRINVCNNLFYHHGNWEILLSLGDSMYILEELKQTGAKNERHKKRDKKCFWHIDYLLMDVNVLLEDIAIISAN